MVLAAEGSERCVCAIGNWTFMAAMAVDSLWVILKISRQRVSPTIFIFVLLFIQLHSLFLLDVETCWNLLSSRSETCHYHPTLWSQPWPRDPQGVHGRDGVPHSVLCGPSIHGLRSLEDWLVDLHSEHHRSRRSWLDFAHWNHWNHWNGNDCGFLTGNSWRTDGILVFNWRSRWAAHDFIRFYLFNFFDHVNHI